MANHGFSFPRFLHIYILLIFILLRGKKRGDAVGLCRTV